MHLESTTSFLATDNRFSFETLESFRIKKVSENKNVSPAAHRVEKNQTDLITLQQGKKVFCL